MSYGSHVKYGTVEVEYVIRQYDEKYDWISNAGESDYLYDSIEEAEQAAIDYHGG